MTDTPVSSWDTPSVDKVEFYRDNAGEYRWRYIREGNNEVMADSGEGYRNLRDAERAAIYLFDVSKVTFAIKLKEG